MNVAMQPYRILYVGDLWSGSTALHRLQALRDLGATVVPIDTKPDALHARERSLPLRILRRLAGPVDLVNANSAILRAAASASPDILWIDKGLTIDQDTLHRIRARHPHCTIVGYSPDDMLNPGNQSRRFLAGLPLYDVYFTTKTYGVAELQTLGARRAHFIGNAFDPETHRPLQPDTLQRQKLGGAVGFIGQWEAERADSICALAAAGVPVRVWGQDWQRRSCDAGTLRVEREPLWGRRYALALCSFDINLCFLRKRNRDLQTTRTMEIPACGAFMLAERTAEHLALFEEGKEAEYFDSDAELIEKVRYYLAHPQERAAIAAAGRQRCLSSGYSTRDRAAQMLQVIGTLPAQAPAADIQASGLKFGP